VEDTPEERIDKANNAREIVHRNTRFDVGPFSADKSKQSLSGAASAQARMLPGRIGPDGKEILPAQSPRVGGYGFVATPSPAPGKIFSFVDICDYSIRCFDTVGWATERASSL